MKMRSLLILLLCLVATPLYAARPYSAKYTVHYNGFKVGEMRQRYLPQENGNWALETEMKTTGLVSWFKSDKVVERSVVAFVNDKPRPLSYLYHYYGNHEEVIERLDFDWKKMRVSSLRDGKTTELPLHKGVHDKQSYQLAMRKALHRGTTDFVYAVADRGEIEQYELQVIGEEPQVTTFGTVDTLVVKKGTTTLWLAKEYDYLVVKIEQREDGNVATSYITSRKPFAVDTSARSRAADKRTPDRN